MSEHRRGTARLARVRVSAFVCACVCARVCLGGGVVMVTAGGGEGVGLGQRPATMYSGWPASGPWPPWRPRMSWVPGCPGWPASLAECPWLLPNLCTCCAVAEASGLQPSD